MTRAVLCGVLAPLWIAALAAGVLAAAPSTQPGGAGVPGIKQSWSRYEVVVDRDIFMRHAWAGGGSRRRGVVFPESSRGWVLSGTALLANDRVAFLENTQSGTTIRAHVGDTTDAGRIMRIDADHFDLNVGGQVVSVPIGSTLDGKPREAATTQAATEPADTQAEDSADSSPAAPPMNSVEAAMRARREQELSHH